MKRIIALGMVVCMLLGLCGCGGSGGMGGMKAVSSDQTESKETAITVSGDSYPLTVTDYFDHET